MLRSGFNHILNFVVGHSRYNGSSTQKILSVIFAWADLGLRVEELDALAWHEAIASEDRDENALLRRDFLVIRGPEIRSRMASQQGLVCIKSWN
jgi:hypothetical protein